MRMQQTPVQRTRKAWTAIRRRKLQNPGVQRAEALPEMQPPIRQQVSQAGSKRLPAPEAHLLEMKLRRTEAQPTAG